MTDNNINGSTRVKPAGRRRFTKAEKAQIIADYDAATTPTERGIVLRKWGTYQQNVSRWTKEQAVAKPDHEAHQTARENKLAKQLAETEKKLAASNDRVELLEELVEAQGKVVGLHAKNAGSPPPGSGMNHR